MSGPADNSGDDELPAEIVAAWNGNDLDVVAGWLLSVPRDEPWGSSARDKASVLAEVFLPIDPAVSLRLVDRLLEADGDDVHLLQISIDAAARSGRHIGLSGRVEHVRSALEGVEPDIRAAVLNNVGTFLKDARQFDRAEALLREVLADVGSSTAVATRVTVLVNLATVLADRVWSVGVDVGQGSAEALETLAAAERLAADPPQARALGNIWFNRGHILAVSGASARAAHAYRMAEEWFGRGGGDPVDMAYVCRARAADAGRNGRLDDAIADYSRARDLFADAGRLDESATAAVGLVMAMQLSGSSPTPEQLRNVLDALRRSRPERVPELLVNLGNIAAEQHQLERSAAYFADARRIFVDQDRPLDELRTRHSLAVIRRRSGDAAGALQDLRAVHANYLRRELAVKAAEAEFNLAVALRDLGDLRAGSHAVHAFEVLDRHRHQLGSAADRSGLIRVTYRHLLDLVLETASGDPDTIAALAERARTQTAAEKSDAPGTQQLSAPSPVAARPGAPAIRGQGRVRVLSELATELAGSGAIWLTWVRRREQLLCVLVGPESSKVTTHPYPQALLAALEASTCLESASSEPQQDSRNGGERAALFRIATGPLLADRQLADRLRRSMRPGAAAWAPGPNGEGADLLRELGMLLIPEAAWGAQCVVIAPPPFLGGVPWAALQRDGAHWVEHSRLVLAPPVSTIRTGTVAHIPGRRSWIADATGDLRYCRKALSGFAVVDGRKATAAAVVDALRGSGRAVVRTHVRPGSPANPGDAALLLADGPLTAGALHEAIGRVPPEWVILGCDAAGAGVGDEWAGLPIGLGAAGAERVVVTGWPIVDAPEQEALDLALVTSIERYGIRDGLYRWQRDCARRWRETGDRSVSPHRWAGHGLVISVTSSDRSRPT